MKPDILSSLSYGMYAVGVKDGGKISACIVNTVIQVSNKPNIVAVSMNHNNYTHDCIEKNGLFTVSVLSENTSGTVVGALGFSSGRDSDKLANVRYRVLSEGVPIVEENICCWFLCKVTEKLETHTHTLYLAEVIAGSDKWSGKPMTYDFYHKVIKGRAPKNAPTYREVPDTPEKNDVESYICTVCGYVYSDPYVPFEELPDNWTCPICGAPKSAFKRRK